MPADNRGGEEGKGRQASPPSKRGFSLLEVIIATAILAASAVILMSMFSSGDRHAERAEKRSIGQMLCQSKLDEILSAPDLLIPTQAEPFPSHPGWVWSLEATPTSIDEFIKLRIQVRHLPGQPVTANLTPTATAEIVSDVVTADADTTALPTYEIVRWTRYDGSLDDFSSSDDSFSSEEF